MKNFWRILLCAAVLSFGFASCDQLQEDPGELELEVDVTLGEPSATSNTATLAMTLPEGVTDYAYTYYRAEKLPSRKPSAGQLFRNPRNIVECEAGEQNMEVDGLYPKTKYIFYLAFRDGTKLYKNVLDFEVTTGEIKDDFKVLGKTLEGFTIYMKLPKEVEDRGNVIRYNSCDIVTYNEQRMTGSLDDNILSFNGSKWFGELKSDNLLHNSDELNYVMNHENCYDKDGKGNYIYDEDGNRELVANIVVPGEPTVFVAGEYANETFNGLPWQGAMFDYAEYIKDYGAPSEGDTPDMGVGGGTITPVDVTKTDKYWKGYFRREKFYTQMPEPLPANIKITVSDENIGAISAALIIEPDDQITEFCIYVIDHSTYVNSLEKLLEGDEKLMQWFTTSSYAFNIGSRVVARPPESDKWDEPVRIQIDEGINIKPETTYYVHVVGVGDKSLSHQCYFKTQFKTKEKKLKTPVVEVKAIDNPNGENPFEVWYNVKCTTENAVSGRFACNDTDTWVKMLNSGFSNAVLLNNSGGVFKEEDIKKINSPDGLNMNFPALEASTMRLAVAVFNAENDANNINDPSDVSNLAIADQTTGYLPDKEYIDHEYLKGALNDVWTLTANSGRFVTERVYDDGNAKDVQKWVEQEIKTKVRIMTEVPCPDTPGPEVYAAYSDKEKGEVDALFASFKQAVKVYNDKIKGQNRLILLGFNDNGPETILQDKPMLPYDLFIDKEYNAFDINAILRDWGPKWFIEFNEDEAGNVSMTVPFNSKTYPAMTQCGEYPLYMAALNHTRIPDETTKKYKVTYYHVGPGNETLNFPVTVSENKDEITIGEIYVDGVVEGGVKLPLYPNLIYSNMISYKVMYPVYMEAPVLTRGWTDDASSQPSESLEAASMTYNPSSMPLYTPAPKSKVRSSWSITPFDNVKPEDAQPKDDQQAAPIKYRDVVYKIQDPSTFMEKIHEVSVRKYNLEK